MHPPGGALDPESCREQVTRMLDSDLLRTSESQRRLLRYLGEKSIEGTADQLKEYTVGVEALNKSPSYDPRQDPSVRIQIGKLRQKIEEYYRTQGAADPVRIEFPKGRFKLIFSAAPSIETPAPDIAAGTRLLLWRRASIILCVISILIAATLLYTASRLRTLESQVGAATSLWTPELARIWGPFTENPRRPVLICLGMPLFALFNDGSLARMPLINDWTRMEQSPFLERAGKLFPLPARPAYPFAGFGESAGVFHITKLLSARRPDVTLTRSNVLSWEEVGNSNTIFLGPPKLVPQLKEIPLEQELVIDSERLLIRNLHPRPGEPQEFPDRPHPGESETYALVTRLPGLHGRGEIFILASNWTGGTLGAVQYVTQADYAADLVQRLRLPSGELPRHYQILLRVFIQNRYPVKIVPVLHRVLQQ